MDIVVVLAFSEKLDDFIANIVHLKEAIARQLAIEEAEEMEMLKQQEQAQKLAEVEETIKDFPPPLEHED